MKKLNTTVIGLLVGVLVIGLYASTFTVHQTQQALVLQLGNPKRVVTEPGLQFKLPFIQNVVHYDNRVLDLDPPPQEVNLSDQKRINVDSFARYRIVDPLEFRKTAGSEINFVDIFGRLLNSAVRTEVGKVLLGDMLTSSRAEIMARITQVMKDQAPAYGVEIIDVRIGRSDLPEDTSQAVYDRMRSSRIAQAAKLRAEGEEIKAKIQAEADRERTVILAEARKQSQILEGKGIAEQTRILGDAYGRDPEFFQFYRSMEAYKQALGPGTTMVLTPDSEFFRYFGKLPKGP
ncbi:MAG: protease modulator HflC [Alphaproteobacteria bacterium RIFOXYD12_FULL_60_8]|nr:MAG: protease modulator HflC [Alphaproteobacteria bacterium RIFOXYD12_FULL_60_8]